MLRVEKPGGVVVVCVILCVLGWLTLSEKTNKKVYRRNSTHPTFFFPVLLKFVNI